MTILATAAVPAHCRLSTAETFTFPRLNRLSVLDAADLVGITAYVAFTAGARIRTEADVTAIAATMPPPSPEQIDDLEAWCARAAVTPVSTIAEWYGCSVATAEHVREFLAGVR